MIAELVTSSEDVLRFIPQRSPIVMVDCLYEVSLEDNSATSGLTIKEDNIFVEDGVLSLGGVIEHMAQTAALKSGYEGSISEDPGNAPKGYIGAIKNMRYHKPINLHDKLVTQIKVITQFQQIAVVQAEVKIGTELMASGQLNIFQFKE